MTVATELNSEVQNIFQSGWTKRNGTLVPEDDDVRLANDAVLLDNAVVLYADLAQSTAMVTSETPEFAAEVYKAYLHCAAKIIRNNSGVITSYDGDRIMAVYLGNRKNTNAGKTALQINHAVTKIINPRLHEVYKETTYDVVQVVGVDRSPLLVARTGVRGANDLVWVGRAANYAAKLCEIRDGKYTSWITADVYNEMAEDGKTGGTPARPMWEQRTWTKYAITVYRSNWTWTP